MDSLIPLEVRELYEQALSTALTLGCDEETLSKGYELGQRAFRDGWPIDALISMHHRTLARLISSWRIEPEQAIHAASSFAAEFFAPFQSEIARLRDYQVAQDNLNTKLRQQTRQLDRANEALKAATAAAEAGARTKAEFLAHMSHEIRTPLNAIIGMTGLLLEADLGVQQRDFAETIRSSGDHLLTIINDILDFSKIEAGKVDLEMSTFNLSQCIEDCLDLVSARAAEKGIDIGYFIEPGIPRVIETDLGRLRQILLNLLSNSVKFTAKGEVSVHVGGRTLDASGTFELRISVRDTGVGISKANQSRLFQPFSQVDASTTRVYGGTGLGLSISWRLVGLLGGTMWVDSEVGKGATFYFTTRVTVPTIVAPLDEAAGPSEIDVRDRRVLIVDGNAGNRRILSAYIRMWNLIPVEVETPHHALALLSQHDQELSLVLVEYELPEMTGIDLAYRIRQIPGRASTPMILFGSAVRKSSDVTDAGFRCHLAKPLKPSTLHNVITESLSKPSAEPAVAKSPTKAPDDAAPNPLRILVAEDNAVNQKVAAAILARLGYAADIVGNGREAVAAVEMKPYDVVLMDVQMPEMDGLQATRELCQRFTPLQRPHIVALTANVTEEVRRECLAAGMDSYISKPVTIGKLVDLLRRCTPRAPRSEQQSSLQVVQVQVEPTVETKIQVEDVSTAFWRMLARERQVDLEALCKRLSDEVWKLRSAADRGDHEKGIEAASNLRHLLQGGASHATIARIATIKEMSPETFLRQGIAAVADVQLDVENIQAALRAAKTGSTEIKESGIVIDSNEIQRLAEDLGGAEVLVSLVDEFVHDARLLVETIGQHIMQRKTGDVRAVAHTLKGSSSTFPLPRIRQAAENIEHAAKAGHVNELSALWLTLADEYARGIAALMEAIKPLRLSQ